jgi:anaerobic selenocysteine-containing dehydrogenase
VTRVKDGRLHSVEPNKKHPFTGSLVCPKGRNIAQYVYSKQRLQYPMRRMGKKGSGQFEKTTWTIALKEIASKVKEVSERNGPESILQFDYAGTMGLVQRYFPSRFFNAIGASRVSHTICSRAGDKALEVVYGSTLGMLPDEIERCRLIVVWGMNPAWSSVHSFDMLKRAEKRGAKIYVIDPVKTATTDIGVHLRINPTTDAALALGMVNHLVENRLCNEAFIEQNTTGFDRLAGIAAKYDMRKIAKLTGLKTREIEDFIGDYVSLRPSCIMIGYGMQRHRNGGDMVRAISVLPVMIGENRGFFYSTDLGDFDMDYLEGTALRTRKRVEYNMVDLGRTLQSGKVKMMFVYNANPLATLPNQELLRKGFSRDDTFTVVHDLFQTDTADYADIVLPATSFLEHYDINTSYLHGYLSVNEKAIEPVGESRSNADFFRALASTMKLSGKELFEEDGKVAKTLVSKSKAVEGRFEDITKKGYLKLKVPRRDVYQTPTTKIELYSAIAEAEGLGGLPAHVDVMRTAPYILLSPVHKFLVRSQYHPRWQEIQPLVYISPKDATAQNVENDSVITLMNEFG